MERLRGIGQGTAVREARALTWSKDLAQRAAQQRAWESLLSPKSALALVHTIDPSAAIADVKAAVAKPSALFSLSLVNETHHDTFFGQRVGVYYVVPAPCIAATSASDFASDASLSALEWYERRGIYTPEALLAAAHGQGLGLKCWWRRAPQARPRTRLRWSRCPEPRAKRPYSRSPWGARSVLQLSTSTVPGGQR